MLWGKESDIQGTREAGKDNKCFRILPSKPAHLLLELVSLGLQGTSGASLLGEGIIEPFQK